MTGVKIMSSATKSDDHPPILKRKADDDVNREGGTLSSNVSKELSADMKVLKGTQEQICNSCNQETVTTQDEGAQSLAPALTVEHLLEGYQVPPTAKRARAEDFAPLAGDVSEGHRQISAPGTHPQFQYYGQNSPEKQDEAVGGSSSLLNQGDTVMHPYAGSNEASRGDAVQLEGACVDEGSKPDTPLQSTTDHQPEVGDHHQRDAISVKPEGAFSPHSLAYKPANEVPLELSAVEHHMMAQGPAPHNSYDINASAHSIPQQVRTDNDNEWMDRYEELKHYRIHTGTCMVPLTYPPNQILADWVQAQREYLRKVQEVSSSCFGWMGVAPL
jgi:hypothetical protein